jgi:hypothetical protein
MTQDLLLSIIGMKASGLGEAHSSPFQDHPYYLRMPGSGRLPNLEIATSFHQTPGHLHHRALHRMI